MMLVRKSNFECLRLFAMFCIVLYHLYFHYINVEDPSVLNKSIHIPLHIGVILFILISGYFGIKTSIRGLVALLLMMFIYTVPISMYDILINKGSLSQLLFISHTPFWFMRQYLYLYLLAPILNMFLDKASKRQGVYLLIVLSFISIYCCTLLKGQCEFEQGKNLPNFMLIYSIGWFLRINIQKIQNMPFLLLGSLFLFFNLIEMIIFSFGTVFLKQYIWLLSFPYFSPMLILNATIIFIIFSKISFSSKRINYLAKSTLAIYLLHSHPLIQSSILGLIPLKLMSFHLGFIELLVCLSIYSLLVMIICISVDLLIRPFYWRIGDIISKKISGYL